jgi:hypothetical protein
MPKEIGLKRQKPDLIKLLVSTSIYHAVSY